MHNMMYLFVNVQVSVSEQPLEDLWSNCNLTNITVNLVYFYYNTFVKMQTVFGLHYI